MKKVLLATVVAVAAVSMFATVASAQPDKSRGLEKSQGKAYGLDRQPVCHNGKTLYLPAPAVVAHERHGDDDEECGDVGTPPPEGPGEGGGDGDLAGLVGTLTDENNDGTTDLLTFPAINCMVASDAQLLIEAGAGRTPFTLEDNQDVLITATASGLEVNALQPGGEIHFDAPIEIVSSVGITNCTISQTGTLSTKSGDPVLQTTSGGTLKLKAKSAKDEKRLEALVKKGERVKVTGKKSGKALEVSQLKTTKGKKK